MGNTWTFAVLAGLTVTAIGFGVDWALSGRGFPAPAWPDNAWMLAAFLFFQIAIWLSLKNTSLFEGLSGARLGVVALALLCLWSVFLGSLPQVVRGVEAPIHQRVMQAPPFVLAILLLLANLGWGILKHLSQKLRASSLFLCNHIGVYIVGVFALFGSGDVIRLDVWVKEGDLAWTGSSGESHYELPFAIHLHHFKREFFTPQLTVIDSETGEILLPSGEDMLTLLPQSQGRLMDYEIVVLKSTTEAPWSVPDDPIPAAIIRVTAEDGSEAEGWVSCGSHLMPPIFLGMEGVSFAMPEPRTRLYESEFTLVRPEKEPETLTIRVNEPIIVDGWWLYQKGYNISGGPDSRFSQIEVVRDPWLRGVYTGFLLMGIGSILALGRAASIWRTMPDNGKEFSA